MRDYLRGALSWTSKQTYEETQMFTSELVIAAEDAYRREQLLSLRPPRRTRRTHRTHHPRPDRRRPWSRLVLSRTAVEDVEAACGV